MKKILISISFILSVGFSFSQTPFEGIITYKVETVLKEKNSPYNDYFSKKYGDTLKIYYAENGNIKREYYNSGELGLDWSMYIYDNNQEYTKWHSMDSIFYFDCSELMTQLIKFEERDRKTIMGKECNSLFVEAYEPNGDEILIQQFYFSGEEYVSPKVFENYKDGYLDLVYKKSKSHFLRKEMNLKYVHVVFEAIEIKKVKLSPSLFKVPKDLDMVKM